MEFLVKKVKDVEFWAVLEEDEFGWEQYHVFANSKKQKQTRTLAYVGNTMDEVNNCVDFYAKNGFNFFNKFVLKV